MESMQTVLPEQPVETPIRQLTESVWSESSFFAKKNLDTSIWLDPSCSRFKFFERRLESIEELTAIYKYFG